MNTRMASLAQHRVHPSQELLGTDEDVVCREHDDQPTEFAQPFAGCDVATPLAFAGPVKVAVILERDPLRGVLQVDRRHPLAVVVHHLLPGLGTLQAGQHEQEPGPRLHRRVDVCPYECRRPAGRIHARRPATAGWRGPQGFRRRPAVPHHRVAHDDEINEREVRRELEEIPLGRDEWPASHPPDDARSTSVNADPVDLRASDTRRYAGMDHSLGSDGKATQRSRRVVAEGGVIGEEQTGGVGPELQRVPVGGRHEDAAEHRTKPPASEHLCRDPECSGMCRQERPDQQFSRDVGPNGHGKDCPQPGNARTPYPQARRAKPQAAEHAEKAPTSVDSRGRFLSTFVDSGSQRAAASRW